MNNKKFILNADDFGLSNDINRAIVEGYNAEILHSTSLCANGESFYSAVNEIMPECPKLCVGVHLNIIEGNALNPHETLTELTDSEGNFNNSWIQLLLKSFNKKFMEQLEIEFRSQIEKIISCTKVSHIDSHVHTHGIPNIFKLTCKLAKEYGIPYVRTQFERPYLTNNISKHINLKYPVNQIKVLLLDSFSILNKKVIEDYGLKTNDFLVGVSYTGMMDNQTVEQGLEVFKNESDIVVEALFHPYPSHVDEYKIIQNQNMKFKIENYGFEFTTYRELVENNYEKTY